MFPSYSILFGKRKSDIWRIYQPISTEVILLKVKTLRYTEHICFNRRRTASMFVKSDEVAIAF